jgi:RNA-binding protein
MNGAAEDRRIVFWGGAKRALQRRGKHAMLLGIAGMPPRNETCAPRRAEARTTMEKQALDKALRRRLTAEAHHLKPVFNVGKDGLNEAFLQSLAEAFNTRELLKIRLLEACDETRASLSEKLDALPEIYLLQNIGRVFILYKERKKEKA